MKTAAQTARIPLLFRVATVSPNSQGTRAEL
jgi:hypothetical protein